MLACPGVLTKVAPGFTGFGPSVMAVISSQNWSSIMTPDCVLTLEDTIDERSLVITIFFVRNQNKFTNNYGWNYMNLSLVGELKINVLCVVVQRKCVVLSR